MMVRLLSVLPGIVGIICVILLLGSLVGVPLGEERSTVPMVPCLDDDLDGCLVGMTPEIRPPMIFILLDIQLTFEWEKYEESWIGVVPSSSAENCPPHDNGLTDCTAEDFTFVAGGDSITNGKFTWDMGTEDYRFVSGGREGTNLDDQLTYISTEVSFNPIIEIMLGLVSFLLLVGAGEMAFPLKKLWNKFRDA